MWYVKSGGGLASAPNQGGITNCKENKAKYCKAIKLMSR